MFTIIAIRSGQLSLSSEGSSPSSSPTSKTAYCIYVDKQDTCAKLAESLSTDKVTYTAKNLTIKDVNTTSVPSEIDTIVMFVQPNEITSKQLKILMDSKKIIYANGNEVKVKVEANAEMTVIPNGLTYTGGPIVFKPTGGTSLSIQEIKKINIEIKLQAPMDYTIYDTCDCALPSNFKVDTKNKGALKYILKSENLNKTRLIIDGDSIKWGKTTVTPGTSELTLPASTIISCTAKAPKTPIKVGEGCFFDESFTGKTSQYAEMKTSAYVLDSKNVGYIKKMDSETPTQYTVYCLHDDSVEETAFKTGCPDSGFKTMTQQKISKGDIADHNIVAFNENVKVPSSKLTILQRVLLTENAKSITIECETGKIPDQAIDVRKGIWSLTKAAAAVVPGSVKALEDVTPLTVTFKGTINPKAINSNPKTIKLAAGGLSITPDDSKESVDLSKPAITGDDIPIVPYLDGDAKVEVQNGKIVVNGAIITVPSKKKIALQAIPGQSVSLSQKGATKDMKISISSTGNVAFDSTWNSIKEPFVSVTGATISTQFVGTPPWLDSSSIASLGVIEQPKPVTPETPSSGLEGWAIALIVIACVIVVGAIVVAALNMTGVIHLCGKKKVEV